MLPFGEWRPDVADYESATQAHTILNAVPRGDGYGPFPSFTALSATLPAACRGAFFALKSDGTVQLFAGTSNALFTLNGTNLTWTPVSRVANVTSISNASPGVVTYANSFAEGEPVVLSTTGSLPTGLTAGTVYYVKNAGGASFNLSATAGGTAINTSSAGSGTHSITAHYTALSATKQWQFAQFGSIVLATQGNEPLQAYTMGSSSAFANNAGSPPQADYITVVGRFVVLSGLTSNPYRIQWSGLNDTTQWTSGVNSSDFQDFPDGGVVRSVAGANEAAGVIFQDQAIRRMSYLPGSTVVFQIERLTDQMGIFGPYSVVRGGSTVFFSSTKGFCKIEPGQFPEQIGRERVDRTLVADIDNSNLQLFLGAADPKTSRVYWPYKSTAGASGLFDKVLGYDYALSRWFLLSVSGEYLCGIAQAGMTLEGLDTVSSSIDALTSSLDAIANSSTPEIAAFDSTHAQGFFRGANLEATLETGEQGADPDRIMVGPYKVITDADSFYGRLACRDTQLGEPVLGNEIIVNTRTGKIDVRQSTGYARMRVRIPASQIWTFAAGVVPDIVQDGDT